jgi:hypothetical protein
VKPADPLDGLLPPAPPGRDLPHHDRRRGELLAIVGSEHTPGHRRPVPAWLAPLGAALAVLVIVAGVFVLPGLLGGPRSGGHAGGATAPAAQGHSTGGRPHGPPIERTESYLMSSAVGLLRVQDSVSGVSITGANRSTISITAHLVYRGGAPQITRRMTGRTLELGYTCPAQSRNCGVSFDLTVPRDFSAIVDLEVGPIRLSGLSGTISAHTGVGPIRATGMSAQRVALSTGTGMISAGFAVPPQLAVAHAGTGSVAIRVPPGTAYKVTASSQVGSVRITVPQAAASSHVIHATTGIGTVTVTGS